MRYLTIGAVLWLPMGAPASAQPSNAQLMAPIQKFIDSFNKGDVAGAAATHAPGADLTIIDEVPPYVWRGSKALDAWSADLASDAKKRGITDPVVTISAPTRVEASGDQAYLVVPAVYTFRDHGTPMRETAQLTVVLKQQGGAWLIHGWTWTGPKPQKTGSSSQH